MDRFKQIIQSLHQITKDALTLISVPEDLKRKIKDSINPVELKLIEAARVRRVLTHYIEGATGFNHISFKSTLLADKVAGVCKTFG